MNIIITMAGLGSRFTEAGYTVPKYMIEVKGKTLFEWSMLSLVDYNKHVNKYVFVVRKEHNASNFIKNKMNEFNIFNVDVVEIDYLTKGQAATALLGVEKCDDAESILVFNIDTYIIENTLKYSALNGDGHIPCFKADGTHWSFVREENGKVVEIVEKQRISDNCSIGAYYFKSALLYKEIYRLFYSGDSGQKEEYIAPMYQYMINVGYNITFSLIDSDKVHVLGTPKELEAFANTNT